MNVAKKVLGHGARRPSCFAHSPHTHCTHPHTHMLCSCRPVTEASGLSFPNDKAKGPNRVISGQQGSRRAPSGKSSPSGGQWEAVPAAQRHQRHAALGALWHLNARQTPFSIPEGLQLQEQTQVTGRAKTPPETLRNGGW